MTKKNYVKMAEAFNKALKTKDAEEMGINQLVNTFVEIAKEENPNFDKTRFWDAVKIN